MKKIILPLIGIFLLSVGIFSWHSSTYGQAMTCAKTIDSQISIMRAAWQKNLTVMMDQEKPASEMVDEAFEGISTYRCWLDYLCEAVLYSANADPKSTRLNPEDPNSKYRALTAGRVFSSAGEIELVPGCAYPDSLGIPGTQIEYIPACRVGNENTGSAAQGNYSECREQVQRDFLGDKDLTKSSAFIALISTLKNNSAQQLARPLRDKFSSILLQMNAMEGHMSTLVNQVVKLDSRLPCYAGKCD